MKRLIDANALLLKVRNSFEYDETGCGAYFQVVDKKEIKNAPTIEAKPVKHGYWKDVGGSFLYFWCCSCCGAAALNSRDGSGMQDKSNYCPYCGARMDGDE